MKMKTTLTLLQLFSIFVTVYMVPYGGQIKCSKEELTNGLKYLFGGKSALTDYVFFDKSQMERNNVPPRSELFKPNRNTTAQNDSGLSDRSTEIILLRIVDMLKKGENTEIIKSGAEQIVRMLATNSTNPASGPIYYKPTFNINVNVHQRKKPRRERRTRRRNRIDVRRGRVHWKRYNPKHWRRNVINSNRKPYGRFINGIFNNRKIIETNMVDEEENRGDEDDLYDEVVRNIIEDEKEKEDDNDSRDAIYNNDVEDDIDNDFKAENIRDFFKTLQPRSTEEVYDFERMRRTSASFQVVVGSKSCKQEGERTADNHVRLCTTCYREIDFGPNIIPQFAKSVECDSSKPNCLLGNGYCVQKVVYYTFQLQESVNRWTPFAQPLNVSCECQCKYDSLVHKIFVGGSNG